MHLICRLLSRIGLRRPRLVRITKARPARILIAGGYGYGNTGDEAQLGANVTRWRESRPDAELIVLSPNPEYTAKQHGVQSLPASRMVFFESHKRSDYGASSCRFQKEYWGIKRRLMLATWCMRLRLPTFTVNRAEADFLELLGSASLLHLSGGGYLTGMTQSRLWDHMLLLRLAKALGVPSVLTGHTIGVFQTKADRNLAKWGLQCPKWISVRDRDESLPALAKIGIAGDHVRERFDDALFCDQIDRDELVPYLQKAGIDPEKPYVAVNTHDWGQTPEMRSKLVARMAELCDYISDKHNLQILFIPMVKSDEGTILDSMKKMNRRAAVLAYDYDYRVVRAAIGHAVFCLTLKHHPIIFAMGNRVPCIALSVDDYYRHKNQGALALFGMERYLLHDSEIFGGDATCMINEVLNDRVRLARNINAHLPKYVAAQCPVQDYISSH